MSLIWPLPKVTITSLSNHLEKRPVALISNKSAWGTIGSSLNLPLVVQAEPTETGPKYLHTLGNSLPKQVEVVYAVGTGLALTAAKVVASANNLPLVIVPDALESDALFEAHVIVPAEGLLNRIETGPAQEVVIDWDVIQAAPREYRSAAMVDILAIVTALLDWRFAARNNKNTLEQRFSSWGAGVAASLASHAIKSAKEIGDGSVDGLRTLLDLLMMSVQLAGQLGHDRHQEGTEHYFAFSMENQSVVATHAELVGAGILFASALHGQDPASLRDALTAVGINMDGLRASDIQLAVQDLPTFAQTNDLPYARAHELDPFGDEVSKALDKAGILHEPVAEEAMPTIIDTGTIEPAVPVDNPAETQSASDNDTEELPSPDDEEATPNPAAMMAPPPPKPETSSDFLTPPLDEQ